MQEKIFHREEYPLDILAEYGLSEEMIYDLPDFVHTILEMGGKSPLLPITIQQPFGVSRAYAKFCLVDTDEGLDVLFSPKLKKVDLQAFNEKEQQMLLAGKVIVTDIDDFSTTNEGLVALQHIKAFVQLDKDTNGVVYSPTQVIGRNISAICSEYELSGDEIQKFWNGELVTVMADNGNGGSDPVTIGVDLFSDKGIIVVPGSSEEWENTVRRTMPDYCFGNDGCWVKNKHGMLSYVREEDFTQDILDVLNDKVNNEGKNMDSAEQEEMLRGQYSKSEDESRQITR